MKAWIVTFALLLCLAPAMAQTDAPPPEAVPAVVESADTATDEMVDDLGIVALVTLLLTYVARRTLGEEKLQANPAILGWVSIAASTITAVIVSMYQGSDFKTAATAAVAGWLTAQGARRVKKLVNVA